MLNTYQCCVPFSQKTNIQSTQEDQNILFVAKFGNTWRGDQIDTRGHHGVNIVRIIFCVET